MTYKNSKLSTQKKITTTTTTTYSPLFLNNASFNLFSYAGSFINVNNFNT